MNRLPKRVYPLQIALLGGVVMTTSLLALISPVLNRSVRAAWQNNPKVLVDEVWQIVNQTYVDGSFNQVDWQAKRQQLLSKNYTSQKEAYQAIREALKLLNDPYTRFLSPEEYRVLTTQTSGELSGIGIRLELNKVSQILTVVEPIAESPATRSGLQSGDQILAIDGRSTTQMTVEDASSLIRGKAGTPVRLQIRRQGDTPFTLKLTRAKIQLPTVQFALKQEGQDQIGYIRLNEFNAHAASQTRQAIQKLEAQNVDAFVLDLRGNPGGLLHSSIDISRMWVDKGLIVRTVDRLGHNDKITANNTALTNLPLVVLVDGNSASSSEILTGALKDNHRATVVGTTTFGKALVQRVQPLSDGAGLAVTVAHYYTPQGTDISHKGITPDVQVNLTEAQRQRLSLNPALIGTQADPQYTQAVSNLQRTALAQPSLPAQSLALPLPAIR